MRITRERAEVIATGIVVECQRVFSNLQSFDEKRELRDGVTDTLLELVALAQDKNPRAVVLGSGTSARKKVAAKANGLKGGRPRKVKP